MIGVRLAEDLVNLEGEGRWSASTLGPVLSRAFLQFDELSNEHLTALRAWAARLRLVFAAADVEQRRLEINPLLAEGVRILQLATHDGLPAHLHFADEESDLVQRIKALTAGGIAFFAVEARAARMGVCGRPGCTRVFADTSRNGHRIYCSATCGNTHAVQRYRERRT